MSKQRPNLQTDPDDRLYSTQYAAEMFMVTAETIRNWIANGQIEAVKVNGFWKIPRRALLAKAQSVYGG